MQNEIKTEVQMVTFKPSYCLKVKGTDAKLSNGIKISNLNEMTISNTTYHYRPESPWASSKRILTIVGDIVTLKITNRINSFIVVGNLIKTEPLTRKNTMRITQKRNEACKFLALKFNCQHDFVMKIITGAVSSNEPHSRESIIKQAYDICFG